MMNRAEILKELEIELNEVHRHQARLDFLRILLDQPEEKPSPLKVAAKPTSHKSTSAIEKYIADHPDHEPEVFDFLRQVEVLPSEVSEFIDDIGQRSVGPDEVTRRVKRGVYAPGPSNLSGRRTVCSLSVVLHHFPNERQLNHREKPR
jgi:hypothetical protein